MSGGEVSSAQLNRKLKRINDISYGPVKSLPMTLFMLWMVGNDIHIFSIMMISMAITTPMGSLMQTGNVFKMFEGDESVKGKLPLAKLTYAACCLAALAVGLVKLSWMGLLPTAYADWMDHTPPTVRETAIMAA